MQRFLKESGRAACQGTNRQKIFIADWSHIANVKRDESLCTTRRSDKLHLEPFGGIHLYHSAEIAAP